MINNDNDCKHQSKHGEFACYKDEIAGIASICLKLECK